MAVEFGLHAIALLLPVLGEQDERCGICGLRGEHEVEQDERVRVPLHGDDGHVEEDPDEDDDGLDGEEPGRAEVAGDASLKRPKASES